MDGRGAGTQCRFAIGDGVEGVPVDDDALGAVLRRVAGIGDDDGDRFAGETDLLRGQCLLGDGMADRRARHLQ